MAAHVRYKSWYIFFLHNNLKWPNSALSGEREPKATFYIFILNFSPCPIYIY